MATHPSAEKRNRQNQKRRARNATIRSMVNTKLRKLSEAMENKDKAAVLELLPKAISAIMTARSKGVIHKRSASREIARLSRRAKTVIGSARGKAK